MPVRISARSLGPLRLGIQRRKCLALSASLVPVHGYTKSTASLQMTQTNKQSKSG
jgi:hypothetical protein